MGCPCSIRRCRSNGAIVRYVLSAQHTKVSSLILCIVSWHELSFLLKPKPTYNARRSSEMVSLPVMLRSIPN